MTILKPWGFLALVSLVLLLLIYILKPNFQQRFISSTYIWKLSLKYKKRKLPINKLKNILLIICQVMILCLLTAVIIKPVKIIKSTINNEVIIIVDTSASMRVNYNGSTRFERAMEQAIDKANETFDANGTVSIVMASSNPYFLVERGRVEDRWDIEKKLLDAKDDFVCSYGANDIDKATALCQDILIDNPNTSIYIYSDLNVNYIPDELNVVNVQANGEHNVAILNAYPEIIDNYYSFVVEVASYGRDISCEIKLDVYGSNVTDIEPLGVDKSFTQLVDLNNDEVKRVVFINSSVDTSEMEDENTIFSYIPDTDKIFSYESVLASIDSDDCFLEDNNFSIYGGTKEPLKVLYASSIANSFFNGILYVMRNKLQDRFDVQLTEVKIGEVPNSGYDLYIYEHSMMPAQAPKDGVVLYCDPDPNIPIAESGFRCGNIIDLNRVSLNLTEEENHPLLKNIVADNITISRYNSLNSIDASYHTLMTCDGSPVLLLKDEEDSKALLMLFSLHYSNLPIIMEFPLLMINVFDYFLPSTIEGNSFEVDDNVTVRSRSPEITVSAYDNVVATIDSFPNTLSVDLPGTYTISQTTYFGKDITENIYVKIPASESNIFNEVDTFTNPIPTVPADDFIEDLLFLLTIGLAAFVFLEWLLKGNEAI